MLKQKQIKLQKHGEAAVSNLGKTMVSVQLCANNYDLIIQMLLTPALILLQDPLLMAQVLSQRNIDCH